MMIIRMELKSDAIWGTGESIPGAEDLTIVSDEYGFPYLKGSTFYGILKEEMINYLSWINIEEKERYIKEMFEGEEEGYSNLEKKVIVSNFVLPQKIKQEVKKIFNEMYSKENENIELIDYKKDILNSMTYIRNFTALEEGNAKEGSLRKIRCIKKGLIFYGRIECFDEEKVKNVIPFIKYIGTLKTRGFGKVKLSILKEEDIIRKSY